MDNLLKSKTREEAPEPDYQETPAEDDPFADFGNNIELTDNDLPF